MSRVTSLACLVMAASLCACFSAPPRPAATGADAQTSESSPSDPGPEASADQGPELEDTSAGPCSPGAPSPDDPCLVCDEEGGYDPCLACRGGRCLAIEQLTGSEWTTCALVETGEALCWGSGERRQIPATLGRHAPPSWVRHLPPLTQIALGNGHACGLTKQGRAYCWGRNGAGQTGVESQEENLGSGDGIFYTPLPVRVPHSVAFVEIVAAASVSCGRTESGAVWCWGAKINGQGWKPKDYEYEREYQATLMVDLEASALVVTGEAACALDLSGSPWCWGRDNCGQLGTSASTSSAEPVPVDWPGAPPEALAAGGGHLCATRSEGQELFCWGCGYEGQTGQQVTDAGGVTTPADRTAILPGVVEQLVLGWRHSCVLTDEGEVHCWGLNQFGALANEGAEVQPLPALIEGLGRTELLGSGTSHTCASDAHQVVRCWGLNDRGQAAPQLEEDVVLSPAVVAAEPAVCAPDECALAGEDACVALGSPHPSEPCLFCGGGGDFEPCFACREQACVPVARVGAGALASCAQLETGELYCWGDQASGLTGSTFGGVAAPTEVAGVPEGVVELEVGSAHACLRTEGGEVFCWGANDWGQLGTGAEGVGLAPAKVEISGVVELSTGDGDATCALRDDGSVWCWGIALDGVVPVDPSGASPSATPVPTPVEGLEAIAAPGALAVGSYHACARVTEGTGVVCWGDATDGVLANGKYGADDDPPGPSLIAAFWDGASALYAGGSVTAAIGSETSEIYLWGRGFEGANGTTSFISTTAATPLDHIFRGEEVLQLGLGGRFGCGLLEGGAVECWGWDRAGELGAWAEDRHPIPVRRSDLPPQRLMAVGHQHVCAVDGRDVLRCWGRNDFGQLGSGPYQTRPSDPTPVAVSLEAAE